MSDELTFRPSTAEDREFLYRVYASTREDEVAEVLWSDEQKDEFLRFQFDAQDTYYKEQFPAACFDIVLRDGEPIGRLYVDARHDEIRLIDIALLPDHRGAGLGGRLMKGVLARGEATGLPVQIHVEHNNPAMRLYDRLGFEKVEEQGIYWLMRWTPGPR